MFASVPQEYSNTLRSVRLCMGAHVHDWSCQGICHCIECGTTALDIPFEAFVSAEKVPQTPTEPQPEAQT